MGADGIKGLSACHVPKHERISQLIVTSTIYKYFGFWNFFHCVRYFILNSELCSRKFKLKRRERFLILVSGFVVENQEWQTLLQGVLLE